ncbi:hypothetical protein EA772_13675 [Pedobacter sp. G11]|uniref:DUF6377 domain-containing protein n=1 Tax=Pedobacter sp. G11 TaxID=2482728 RepID=UPI000F5E4E40|nr:DUF6377 domain-containing protein [Pedobacter sp. G11]AZI26340.1 hypothetical protein EA772_13675 [Pedobacter sp. G11]
MPDSILNDLKQELLKKEEYDKVKLSKIKRLKNMLTAQSVNNSEIYAALFNEYEYYKFDSAFVYGTKLLNFSISQGNRVLVNQSKIKLASLLLHAGLFKETFDYLKEINTSDLDIKTRYDFYCLRSGAYSNLSIYNNDTNFSPEYVKKAISNLDSAIALCKPNSFELRFMRGNKRVISGQTEQPPKEFREILEQDTISLHYRARILTAMAAFYLKEKDHDERVRLLAESAICDIRSSTKETLATLLLAEELFYQGDLQNAYLFIQHSRDDAGFYGNRLRKLKIESILPEIATQINLSTQRQKDRMFNYLLYTSLITIIISLVLSMIFIQLKKLKVKEQIIEDKNNELEDINRHILTTNEKLREYATVTEKYIGFFFDLISGYIIKLDKQKKSVERKIMTGRYKDALDTLNEINIKKERKLLFNTFDQVFISIFPNFVEVLNSMLPPNDRIWPKSPELLTTELRIFALIRLGITDTDSIAKILEYSVNTIYIYKMRIKAKSTLSAEAFDHAIMNVKAV